MDRVVILGLVAALGCASASQAFGQLGPLNPATAPTSDLPGTSIHSVGPPSGAPVQPPAPANLGAGSLPMRLAPAMPMPTPGFVGPTSFDPAGGPLGTGPLAGAPLSDPTGGAFHPD